jgi:hypothetical protein
MIEPSTKSLFPNIDFGFLDLPEVEEIYYLIKYDDAKIAFKDARKCFEESLKYYELDGFVSDHVSILEDLSLLYKTLSFYDNDVSRKM